MSTAEDCSNGKALVKAIKDYIEKRHHHKNAVYAVKNCLYCRFLKEINYLTGTHITHSSLIKIIIDVFLKRPDIYSEELFLFLISEFSQKILPKFGPRHFNKMVDDHKKINPSAFKFFQKVKGGILTTIDVCNIMYFTKIISDKQYSYSIRYQPFGEKLQYYLPLHKVCMLQFSLKCGIIVMAGILRHISVFDDCTELQLLTLAFEAIEIIGNDNYIHLCENGGRKNLL
jgi:hypothetical protein